MATTFKFEKSKFDDVEKVLVKLCENDNSYYEIGVVNDLTWAELFDNDDQLIFRVEFT